MLRFERRCVTNHLVLDAKKANYCSCCGHVQNCEQLLR